MMPVILSKMATAISKSKTSSSLPFFLSLFSAGQTKESAIGRRRTDRGDLFVVVLISGTSSSKSHHFY